MNNDTPRLIEHAFPLEQASLDSVHEKNVRHGHISTLHIWPARRPLAACRAALLATLLPDPGDEKKRRELCEKIGGKLVDVVKKKKNADGSIEERVARETRGGVLRWHGQAKTPDDWAAIQQQKTDLEWFRKEIRKVYGRAPKVLDPFAGGGAIPLEAMRLGCETTAVDINPVAWFILKCTLEYPQKLAGQKKRLPDFVLRDRDFMTDYFKAIPGKEGKNKYRTKTQLEDRLRQHFGEELAKRGKAKPKQAHFNDDHPDWSEEGHGLSEELEADLAWHVRAWGHWVLAEARKELAPFYPTYADWEPLKEGHKPYEKQPMRLVPLKEDGTLDMDALNGNLGEDYLDDETNPRWVAKPTVAYLWARTVRCKDCGATVPLLKTRWLCKKDKKRVMLTMESLGRGNGVRFGIEENVPSRGGNAGQKREHDKKIGAGTTSRSGVTCPCCETIQKTSEIRMEAEYGRTDQVLVAIAYKDSSGIGYRLSQKGEHIDHLFADERFQKLCEKYEPFFPTEKTPKGGGKGAGRAFTLHAYGAKNWQDLHNIRQKLFLSCCIEKTIYSRDSIKEVGYSSEWQEAITSYCSCMLSRTADYLTKMCIWENGAEEIKHLFMRWALQMTMDYAEANPFCPIDRFYLGGIESSRRVLSKLHDDDWSLSVKPNIYNTSAIKGTGEQYDVIVTDPPYYDSIPYSDCMDFFYVWLKRLCPEIAESYRSVFQQELGPKWDNGSNDGELIDDDSRHDKDTQASKVAYEDGMRRAFEQCRRSLADGGRMVVVFANKAPDAWETLTSSLIRAGFVVDGAWPIATEMQGGLRNLNRASLASSVWLVAKKRSDLARPGWDSTVLDEMRTNITGKLHNFWDAGIRGPDFVWAATGPALEAYSKHPIVKKADEPGKLMTVSDFLVHARRMVVEFVVGQVLSGKDSATTDLSVADRLDEQTAYYLLHRNDFGMAEAPTGPVILYAVSCGMTDGELVDTWDLLARAGKKSADSAAEDDDPDSMADTDDDSGSKVKLKTWQQRKGKSLGLEAPKGRQVPIIDRIHRLMHLWKAGDLIKVEDYIDEHGLRRSELFKRVVQSLIELSEGGSSERSILESISNHIGAKGAMAQDRLKLKY